MFPVPLYVSTSLYVQVLAVVEELQVCPVQYLCVADLSTQAERTDKSVYSELAAQVASRQMVVSGGLLLFNALTGINAFIYWGDALLNVSPPSLQPRLHCAGHHELPLN